MQRVRCYLQCALALCGGCRPTYEMAWPDSNYSVGRVSLIEIFQSRRISTRDLEAYTNHQISHGNQSEEQKISGACFLLFFFFYQLNHSCNFFFPPNKLHDFLRWKENTFHSFFHPPLIIHRKQKTGVEIDHKRITVELFEAQKD